MTFQNTSTLDRMLRILLGLLMIWAGWSGVVDGLWQVTFRIFACVPLVTAFLGWCPVYSMLGLSTRRSKAFPGDR